MRVTENLDPGRTTSRLRVLIYTTLFPNSIHPLQGNFVLERMRHLQRFVDMSVVAPVPYFPRLRLNERWYKFANVPHSESFAGFHVDHPRYVVLPKLGMTTHGVSMFTGSLRRVCALLRASDYDLIDAHYVYPDGLAATLLGAALNKPVVVSARGTDINVFSQLTLIRPMVRHVLTRADAVIAVAQSLKNIMVALGCPGEKISVIRNGVDAVKFKRIARDSARQQLGLSNRQRIVLGVGRLLELKGFQILIEAIARLRSRHPDITLLIVGDGPYRTALEKQISDLGVGNHVTLAGARPHEQLALWSSAADLFCLASSKEGCPNVILEAMACGLPIIATRVGGIPEMVDSAHVGTLVDRTPLAFEQALDCNLSRPWDYDAIVAHSRAYSWPGVADNILNIYSEVVARRCRKEPAN